jgi:hypothetical protein
MHKEQQQAIITANHDMPSTQGYGTTQGSEVQLFFDMALPGTTYKQGHRKLRGHR